MRSKVLLLASSIEDESRSVNVDVNTHYPLGLAYIHSYLEEKGHYVNTLFLNDYDYSSCLEIVNNEIETNKPSVLGIQIISGSRVSSFRIIEYVHKKWPDIKLLVGGIHATVMYQQILKKYPFLIVIMGEGEMTMGEILQVIESGQEIGDSINGIAYFTENKVIKTSERELVNDLDQLPFPKHEIFFINGRVTANLLTSRGCPFSCSFCVLDSISRRQVRMRSVDNVIDEIEFLIKQNPQLEKVWIHDDSFFLDNQRVIDFCDEIVRRKIKLQFVCSGRMKPLSKEMVRALERAGFVEVLFGLESGCTKILKNIRKGITRADAIEAFEFFRDSPIRITAFLIVGLPGETLETVMETSRFIQDLQKIKYTYYDDIAILFVYPGTEVHEIAKKSGMINDDYWITDKPIPYFTAENTIQELANYKEIMLSHISLSRLSTLEGIECQKEMIPYIMKYALIKKFGYYPGMACEVLYKLIIANKINIDDLRGTFEERILYKIINNKIEETEKKDILLEILKYYYIENNGEGADGINKALERHIRSLLPSC